MKKALLLVGVALAAMLLTSTSTCAQGTQSIIVLEDAMRFSIAENDTLVAFDSQFTRYGNMQLIDSTATSMSLSQDDPFTPAKDGFVEGEQVRFMILRAGLTYQVDLGYEPCAICLTQPVYFTDTAIVINFMELGGQLPVYLSEPDNYATEIGYPYPNPADAYVQIDFALAAPTELSVEVYNLLGQRVLDQRGMFDGQSTAGFVMDLPNGTYFMRVTGGGMQVTRSFVLSR